jgi:hypothetical protein
MAPHLKRELNHGKEQPAPLRHEAAAWRTTATTRAVTKGNGKTIGVTLRLAPDDREKLRKYAVDNRTCIQKIALQGCAIIVAEDGLTLKGAS